jgi:hypothetical protein
MACSHDSNTVFFDKEGNYSDAFKKGFKNSDSFKKFSGA